MNGRTAPLVLGHRGYRARHPENTLRAFREALDAGADGVECDTQKTADGMYVVIHDPTVDRVTGRRGDVGRMTLDELRALDFGAGERIPLLEELLRMLPPEAYLDLELKEETLTVEDCEAIAALCDRHRDRRRLMISSFGAHLLAPFRRRGFTVGYLVGDEVAEQGATAFARTLLRLRPQYVNLPIQMFERIGEKNGTRLCRFLGFLGFRILFWTINTAAEARQVMRYSRIIVTDDVGEILAARDRS